MNRKQNTAVDYTVSQKNWSNKEKYLALCARKDVYFSGK